MKSKRAHGFDFIDSYSIKLAFPHIEQVLLHLVNLSIEKSKFAKRWKIQLVLPLHKKNDKLEGSNYRPVSHIIEISKIVEYIVHDQVYQHFSINNIFHPNHHGFLENHSTATALIQLYDLWIKAAEKQELSAALLLDQSAAFDVVDHQIFLQKLKVYKFSQNSIDWFKSYLESRIQYIQVESKLSDPGDPQDFGVPQGSILGPLIYIIHCNDFPNSTNSTENNPNGNNNDNENSSENEDNDNGESVMYADDNTDNVHDKDYSALTNKIQNEANKSSSWIKDNKLVCSGEKTKLLIIGTLEQKRKLKNQGIEIEIDVCGERVRETESEKLLGLVINEEMTWKHYLYGEKWREEKKDNFPGLIPKLTKRVGLLKHLRNKMCDKTFNLISSGIIN